MSRVERYRGKCVSDALDRIVDVINSPAAEYRTGPELKAILSNVYYTGAGWGEQDAAAEAAAELREAEAARRWNPW